MAGIAVSVNGSEQFCVSRLFSFKRLVHIGV